MTRACNSTRMVVVLNTTPTERYSTSEDLAQHSEAGWVGEHGGDVDYLVVIEGDSDSGYSAYLPELPGCVTVGTRLKKRRP